MLFDLAKIFLRLGAISFGGPLAHIALMRREFVEERGWLSDQEFLDLNGAVNLIPGPNSTELAMHIGHKRGGNAGLWIAGACFIGPAMLLVLILSALYAKFGSLPQSRAILWGISPVVVVIVAEALLKFAPSALKSRSSQAIALAALLAIILGANEITVILAAALLGLVFLWLQARPKLPPPQAHERSKQRPFPALLWLPGASGGMLVLPNIFWSFLKIGSVIYGSGYVLLAYMRAEFVEKLAWISDRQLLDAVAVGQMTPGPLFTSATFVGYQIGGFWGALAATAGIFLPSFFFVMLVARSLGKLSGSPKARIFLDCVNAASFALMVHVIFQLAQSAFFPGKKVDFAALTIGLCAAFIIWKTKWNPALVLLLGALTGLLWTTLRS